MAQLDPVGWSRLAQPRYGMSGQDCTNMDAWQHNQLFLCLNAVLEVLICFHLKAWLELCLLQPISACDKYRVVA